MNWSKLDVNTTSLSIPKTYTFKNSTSLALVQDMSDVLLMKNGQTYMRHRNRKCIYARLRTGSTECQQDQTTMTHDSVVWIIYIYYIYLYVQHVAGLPNIVVWWSHSGIHAYKMARKLSQTVWGWSHYPTTCQIPCRDDSETARGVYAEERRDSKSIVVSSRLERYWLGWVRPAKEWGGWSFSGVGAKPSRYASYNSRNSHNCDQTDMP